MANLERRILQELIYERVRVSVNLCQLVIFERDLDTSIERAMVACDMPKRECDKLAREYVEAAWQRVEREWHRLRDNIDSADSIDNIHSQDDDSE